MYYTDLPNHTLYNKKPVLESLQGAQFVRTPRDSLGVRTSVARLLQV